MKNIFGRYCLFIVGLFIASIGVAFSTIAGLGTSPVASVPYSVSLLWDVLSFGMWLNVWSVIQILVQIILLRKKCKPVEIIIQTVLAFVYGYLTNFSCWLFRGIEPQNYIQRFMLMAAGCVVLAIGIWIQFKGGVAMLPGEAMNRAISDVTGKRYENIKVLFDVLYIVISAAICLIFFKELKGVREGSIIAAIVIGNLIKLINKGWNKLFSGKKNKEEK